MITQKTTVPTSLYKEYKGNGPCRPLKKKAAPASTHSQPYIRKNPSYRTILTQKSPFPANSTSETRFSAPKRTLNLPIHRSVEGG